mgnify:CR=1 FL=1
MSLTTKNEIPTGAIRYNTDSNKMECFNGTKWMQVSVSSPDLNGGARGFHVGARKSPGYGYVDQIDAYNIASTGSVFDFGDMTAGSADNYEQGGFASSTRGCAFGGRGPGTYMNTIEYITMSSTGNSQNFGDLTALTTFPSGVSNGTRGVRMGGISPGSAPNEGRNTMDYVTIAATGDAVDFGDLLDTPALASACASHTRGCLMGGGAPTPSYNTNRIQYITIASLGNAQDFGDMVANTTYNAAASNSVRGISSGNGANPTSRLDMITIATLGNSIDFGTSTVTRSASTASSSPVRIVIAGGYSSNYDATMDYVSFETGGTAVDFGDLSTGSAYSCGFSNAHGGL